jgi:hypothetical protein
MGQAVYQAPPPAQGNPYRPAPPAARTSAWGRGRTSAPTNRAPAPTAAPTAVPAGPADAPASRAAPTSWAAAAGGGRSRVSGSPARGGGRGRGTARGYVPPGTPMADPHAESLANNFDFQANNERLAQEKDEIMRQLGIEFGPSDGQSAATEKKITFDDGFFDSISHTIHEKTGTAAVRERLSLQAQQAQNMETFGLERVPFRRTVHPPATGSGGAGGRWGRGGENRRSGASAGRWTHHDQTDGARGGGGRRFGRPSNGGRGRVASDLGASRVGLGRSEGSSGRGRGGGRGRFDGASTGSGGRDGSYGRGGGAGGQGRGRGAGGRSRPPGAGTDSK